MNNKYWRGLWLCFWLTNAVTWVAVRTLWMMERYERILGIGALLALAVALVIARRSGFQWRVLVLLLCGLLIGQWWWVETRVLQAFWAGAGFAP